MSLGLFIAFPRTASAQWEQTSGPPDGIILSFAANGMDIFVGTMFSGVFRSTDGGATWESVNSGLPDDVSISCLAVEGTNIFAGTFDEGVFLSKDRGDSWVSIAEDLPSSEVYSLAARGASVFAGLNGGGIFRSTDSGASWMAVNSGLENQRNEGLSIHCFLTMDAEIFAGTDNGLYRSSDDGDSWRNIQTGMRGPSIICLAGNGPNLVALNSGYGARVYLSMDNGEHWEEITERFPAGTSVRCLAMNDRNFFAGDSDGHVFFSRDNGESWAMGSRGLHEGASIGRLATYGDSIFAGVNYFGIYKSIDNGVTWTAASSGLTCGGGGDLVVQGDRLFNGRFVSRDNGNSWIEVGSIIPGLEYVTDVENVGEDQFLSTYDSGVFQSKDGGVIWTSLNEGLPTVHVVSLEVHGIYIFANTSPYGVFRRKLNGKKWEEASSGLPFSGGGHPRELVVCGESLFAFQCTSGFPRVFQYRSRRWTKIDLDITELTRVTALEAFGSRLFAAIDGSVIKPGLVDYRGAIRIPPPDIIETEAKGITILTSSDIGANWTEVGPGLPEDAEVTCLVGCPAGLFAGTRGGGIYVSKDNGASWIPANKGLLISYISDLAVTDKYLFASTNYHGVWRLPLSDLKRK